MKKIIFWLSLIFLPVQVEAQQISISPPIGLTAASGAITCTSAGVCTLAAASAIATSLTIGSSSGATNTQSIFIQSPDGAGANAALGIRQNNNVAYGYDFSIVSSTGALNLKGVVNNVATNYLTMNYNDGSFALLSATDASSVTTGAFNITGGFAVRKRVWMDGLTAASGSPSSICRNANEITINAALTCTVSSLVFKHEFKPIEKSGLELVTAMRPGSFYYNDNNDRQRLGFASEYMADIDIRLADGFDSDGHPRSIDQNAILAASVKAIQELNNEVIELKSRRWCLAGYCL